MGGKTVRGQEETYSNYGVVRLDSSFNMIWERTYGGFNPDSPSQNDVFGGFGEAPDGSIYIAGEWQGVNFAQIMRLNSAGDTLWSRNYGTTDFNDLNIGHDGYAVAAGVTVEYAEYGSWDAWLVKVDEDGEVIWQSVYGGGGDIFGRIIPTSDSGFIAVGETTSAGGLKGLIVKIGSVPISL